MAISMWLSNNKVETAIVEHRGHTFLVHSSAVSAHRIMMIEEIRSGIRVFPNHDLIDSAGDMDRILREEFNKIIG